MMGVNVDRVIVITFLIGSALAGVGGVMVGLVFGRIFHLMGFVAGLKAFTAAVVGGIGSIPGAMLGGLLIGFAEAYTTMAQMAEIVENRVTTATLHATNFLGFNTIPIGIKEGQYLEMWMRDVAVQTSADYAALKTRVWAEVEEEVMLHMSASRLAAS